MTIELRDLRWAVVTAQHRSLRQAAENLRIRQSTLSRRLRSLEFGLGAALFERTNGGTRPSAAGREFLETATRIIEETDAAFARLRARSTGENGRLSLGLYTSLARGNLRATLAEYRRNFPCVDVQTLDGNQDGLICNLATGAIDVAIMTTYQGGWRDRSLPLWSERLVAAVPEHHRLRSSRTLSWQDLSDERVLLPQRGPGPELERLLLAKCPSFSLHRVLRHDVGLDQLLSLVGAEYGILVTLEGATGVRCDGVIFREIHEFGAPAKLDFSAYWRAANNNPTLDSFLLILQERYPDLSGETAAASD